MASDISVGSVSVDIVPSAKGFDSKAEGVLGAQVAKLGRQLGEILSENLRAALKDAHVEVDLDTAGATGHLAELTAEIEAVPDIHVNADVDTGAAVAHLAGFQAIAAAFKPGGSGGGGLASLGSLASKAGEGVASLTESLGPTVIVAGLVVAALVPLVGVLGGLTAALAVPLSAAAGGGTLFAFLAGKFFADTSKVGKQIDDLRKKADGLSDPKAKAQALAQAQALEASLTGPQKALLAARSTLSKGFGELTAGKAGDALAAPLAGGMLLLAKILPKIEPVITSVSTAITGLLSQLGRGVASTGFSSFIAGFARLAGLGLTAAGQIIGSIATSIGAVFRAGSGTGVSALNGLVGAFGRLSTYLNSTAGQAKLQSFFAWVRANAPTVGAVIGQIVKYIVDWSVAVAPLGVKLLQLVRIVVLVFDKSSQLSKSIQSGVVPALHALGDAASAALTVLRALPARIAGLAGDFLSAGKKLGSSIIKGIGDGLRAAGGFVSNLAGSIKNAINSALHLPVHIHGPGPLPDFNIPAFANGVTNFSGGVARVGERGEELVVLPRGSDVIPNHKIGQFAPTSPAAGTVGSGPVDLSAASIAALATAILAGAQRVANGAVAGNKNYEYGAIFS